MLTKNTQPHKHLFLQTKLTYDDNVTTTIQDWLDYNTDVHPEILEHLNLTPNLDKYSLSVFLHKLVITEVLEPFVSLKNELVKQALRQVDWVAIANNYLEKNNYGQSAINKLCK